MKYRRIKAAAIAVLFLIAGVLYSASRSRDIFLYESSPAETESSADMSRADGSKSSADMDSADGSESSADMGRADGSEDNADIVSAIASAEDLQVHVHVCGAVKKAGVYEIPADSIIEDAIEAAGGVIEGGAADYLNLAGTVSEGDKIYVPFLKDLDDPYGMAVQSSAADSFSESSQSTLVNINLADRAQLMTLSGIGEIRAEAIISYRETNGSFQKIEDIMKVSGIKEGAFEKIKDQITV